MRIAFPEQPASRAAVVRLGYVGERGSKAALDFLIAVGADTESPLASSAVVGLGLTGKPQALKQLRALERVARANRSTSGGASEADQRGQGRSRQVLELDTLAELITAHQDLSTRGRRAYYGCRARH